MVRQAQGRSTLQDSHPSASCATSTSTPAPQPVFIEQEWQKTAARDSAIDLEWAAAEGEDEQEWECVACGKSFRSEAAWDNHERSRKHIKAVEALKREMEQDNEELKLEEGIMGEASRRVESPTSRSGSGSGRDWDEVEHSTFAEGEDLSLIDLEGLKVVSNAPEDQPHLPSLEPRNTRKVKNLPRVPSPEIIAKSRKRSRKRDIPLDPRLNDALGDIANSSQEPQVLSKKEKRRAREAAKVTENKLQAEKLVGSV